MYHGLCAGGTTGGAVHSAQCAQVPQRAQLAMVAPLGQGHASAQRPPHRRGATSESGEL